MNLIKEKDLIVQLACVYKSDIAYENNQTIHQNNFELVIYRCNDRYCTECVNYDPESKQGLCTRCHNNYLLVENR